MNLTTTNFKRIRDFMGFDETYRNFVGRSGELLVADIFKTLGIVFEHTPNENEPLDFKLPGIGIELKTMAAMKVHEVVMRKEDMALKAGVCKKMHLMGFTVAVSIAGESVNDDGDLEHEVELYYKPGFKRFLVRSMLPFEDLLWEILEMQGLVNIRDGKEHEAV